MFQSESSVIAQKVAVLLLCKLEIYKTHIILIKPIIILSQPYYDFFHIVNFFLLLSPFHFYNTVHFLISLIFS